HAIRHRASEGAMLEIGTFSGQSSCTLAYLREKFGASGPLFTCDIWRYDEGAATPASPIGDSRDRTFADYNRFMRDSYVRNAQFFCPRSLPHTIHTDSDAFFAAWDAGQEATDVFGRTVRLGGPLSFCFIDGNHSYEYTRRDFENTDRLLERGGFILFDDSADDSPWVGVRQLVAEVLASGKYQLISQNPNHLVRKR
ncbi:MAG: class I SAM-dependent methyltransferase, partial [Verrucomicrobia bacterium]|nr:class I SAM-dependent methyltransferase [Verrucomicrobiota bacterium]